MVARYTSWRCANPTRKHHGSPQKCSETPSYQSQASGLRPNRTGGPHRRLSIIVTSPLHIRFGSFSDQSFASFSTSGSLYFRLDLIISIYMSAPNRLVEVLEAALAISSNPTFEDDDGQSSTMRPTHILGTRLSTTPPIHRPRQRRVQFSDVESGVVVPSRADMSEEEKRCIWHRVSHNWHLSAFFFVTPTCKSYSASATMTVFLQVSPSLITLNFHLLPMIGMCRRKTTIVLRNAFSKM